MRKKNTDRLFGMEDYVVDASIMSWQLVNDSPRSRVPDVDKAVGRTGRHFGAVSRPRAAKQILYLKIKYI